MNTKPYLLLPVREGLEVVNSEEILSIKSDNKRVILTMDEGKEIIVRLSIQDIYQRLNKDLLIRCHRCHIIQFFKSKEDKWSLSFNCFSKWLLIAHCPFPNRIKLTLKTASINSLGSN